MGVLGFHRLYDSFLLSRRITELQGRAPWFGFLGSLPFLFNWRMAFSSERANVWNNPFNIRLINNINHK